LESPYYNKTRKEHLKLWRAHLQLPVDLNSYFDYYGMPIRYHHTKAIYPQSYYQTAFSRKLGSAEMPSAGRAFTPELITRLVSKGVLFAPILLHTGVASLEIDEKPYEEYYEVPESSAAIINLAKSKGGRIIAVGTTVVRAIETVSQTNGNVQAGADWTNTFITPERGLFTIDALLTGFHEPRASHLLMLEALSGRKHLQKTYQAALNEKYQWHEFGDLHLILP
jgi:S-adenosylmethionine:tRNA ribosyltransferase-isomerase